MLLIVYVLCFCFSAVLAQTDDGEVSSTTEISSTTEVTTIKKEEEENDHLINIEGILETHFSKNYDNCDDEKNSIKVAEEKIKEQLSKMKEKVKEIKKSCEENCRMRYENNETDCGNKKELKKKCDKSLCDKIKIKLK